MCESRDIRGTGVGESCVVCWFRMFALSLSNFSEMWITGILLECFTSCSFCGFYNRPAVRCTPLKLLADSAAPAPPTSVLLFYFVASLLSSFVQYRSLQVLISHLGWVYMGVKILSLAVKSFFDREKASLYATRPTHGDSRTKVQQ